MYAIVDVAGQQFKVTKDQKIFVHRLDVEEGAEVKFDKVLLIDNDDKVEVGEPVIKGALIKGKILEHLRGDTVKVFKKKRRKGYKVLNGHRQYLSHVLIEEIIEKDATKSVAKRETTKPAQTQKAAEKATPKAVSTKKTVAKSSEAKTKTATTNIVKSTPATKKPAAKKAKPKTETKTSTKKATTTKSGSKVTTAAKKKPTKKTTSSKKTKE